MSLFETLEADLAENLAKRKVLVRSIIEMEKSYNHDEINPDEAIDQITDWKFDLFILNKEANRIIRKMMECEEAPADPYTDLSD